MYVRVKAKREGKGKSSVELMMRACWFIAPIPERKKRAKRISLYSIL